jgi:hypothetical protein
VGLVVGRIPLMAAAVGTLVLAVLEAIKLQHHLLLRKVQIML